MESLNLQNGGKRGSSRKGPSKKQLAALAKGRAIRAKNIRNNSSGKKKSSKKKLVKREELVIEPGLYQEKQKAIGVN